MIALTLSLACSLSWGVSDFLGGFYGRRIPVLTIVLVSQIASFTAGLITATALSGLPPADAGLLWALGAGACGLLGIGALYRALALGTMSVVAPIAATSALLPIALRLASGERPSLLQSAGMLLMIGGVLAASRQPVNSDKPRGASAKSIALAGVAALGFGGTQVFLGAAAEHDVWWTIGLMRVGGIATLAVFIIATGAKITRPGRASLGPLVGIGLLDISAATLYAAATTHGLHSLVAALGSLYPAVTVVLARFVLQERMAVHQAIGIVAVLGGVTLAAAAG